jgi:general stress protein 26
MADQEHLNRVWDIIERVGVSMLTTHFAGGFRARPVEPRLDRAAGLIWVVTDLRSAKEHEIETEHDVGLTCVDAKEKAYLSITARAEVRRDPAKAAAIWRCTDNLWWHGPDDPNLCVLRITPFTRSSGTARQARRSPFSNSSRRSSPAPSRISARTAR